MAFQNRVEFPDSQKSMPRGAQRIGAVPDNELVQVTITLRRKTEPADTPGGGGGQRVSREQFAQLYGADPQEVAKVRAFARAFGLEVVESDLVKRRMVLAGSADAMAKAFNTSLERFTMPRTGEVFRARTGALSLPVEVMGAVTSVLGLDTRPVAEPHFRIRPPVVQPTDPFRPAATAGTFSPPQVAAAYEFPTNVNGAGQTIAILELGGGYSTSDLRTYFSGLGLRVPNVAAVSVDGGHNSPGANADIEVMLDIEVAGSIANGANLAVYFAPNTDRGFIDAVLAAVHDTARNPSVISISWGAPEEAWTAQAQKAMNQAFQDAALLGVTITSAAGDSGSTEGASDGRLHVDFPAASPYALACGGTTLSTVGNQISSEVVWNQMASGQGATGGGISTAFALPAYQTKANVPLHPQSRTAGRGLPDIAANADPVTGYQVRVHGQNWVLGGTSAVAPLWAALIALINQKLGRRVGYIHPSLYGFGTSRFRDITSGSNDDGGLGYFKAGLGWDACTGLGSPRGAAILDALQSANPGPPPPPPPSPPPSPPPPPSGGGIWDFPTNSSASKKGVWDF